MFEKINDNLVITAPDETDDNPVVIGIRDRESKGTRWVLAAMSMEDLQELYMFMQVHFGIGL